MVKEFKTSDDFRDELHSDIKRVYELYTRDPLVYGVFLYKILEERENTNRILKTLLRRIELLEKKILSDTAIQKSPSSKPDNLLDLLSEADSKIVEIVKEKGKATAKEVAKAMNYKGANAASARMNRLYEAGILKKKRIGKKVYFLLS